MNRFAALFSALEATNKTNEKLRHLTEYFESAPAEDAVWVLYFLLGRRPRRAVPPRRLAAWACEIADIPEWLFDESYDVVGDLAETISLVLGDHATTSAIPLHQCVEEGILSLQGLSLEEQKSRVTAFWRSMDPRQRFLFNKLITGESRFGVSAGLVVRSLAKVSGIEAPILSHRVMGEWQPTAEFFGSLLVHAEGAETDSRPYPFFLAQPLMDAPETLGAPDEWQAEWKWDGIRAQLLRRDDAVYLWSRGEELITDRFPELQAVARLLPKGLVIDGEILPVKEGRVLPFAELQRRIGRKNLGKKILADVPVALMAYDLLEVDGADIRTQPLHDRRSRLEAIVSATVGSSALQLSPTIPFSNWNEIAEARKQSRVNQVEGIMLKHRDSPYRVGRVRGDWWKWKIEPLTMDAVLILAQRGSGKRASLYTDYTFGVWDGTELVPVAKAYSGLTDDEIQQVDRFVRQNIIERFGPVRAVQPALVFEIGFEAIARSPRHKSGIAVRFPRMLRWRQDKSIQDADTIETLRSLLPPAKEMTGGTKGRKPSYRDDDLPLFDELQ